MILKKIVDPKNDDVDQLTFYFDESYELSIIFEWDSPCSAKGGMDFIFDNKNIPNYHIIDIKIIKLGQGKYEIVLNFGYEKMSVICNDNQCGGYYYGYSIYIKDNSHKSYESESILIKGGDFSKYGEFNDIIIKFNNKKLDEYYKQLSNNPIYL